MQTMQRKLHLCGAEPVRQLRECERCAGTESDGCIWDIEYIEQGRFVCTSCSDEIMAEEMF